MAKIQYLCDQRGISEPFHTTFKVLFFLFDCIHCMGKTTEIFFRIAFALHKRKSVTRVWNVNDNRTAKLDISSKSYI